jgi:hypothetical protein
MSKAWSNTWPITTHVQHIGSGHRQGWPMHAPPPKFFSIQGKCKVEFKVQEATEGDGSGCKLFWELRYFRECLRNSSQRHHHQVERAKADLLAHGIPEDKVQDHIWQSKRGLKCRSQGPGMIMPMDIDDDGSRAQEEPESMPGEAGEGAKAQHQVSNMLSVSTRALITMLMMAVKCNRDGERQERANQVMMSIIMWCMPDIHHDLRVLVQKALGQKAVKSMDITKADMKHSKVIDAMVRVTNKPQAIPLIVKLTQLIEEYITQKEGCGVMASGTHIMNASIQTTYISTNSQCMRC